MVISISVFTVSGTSVSAVRYYDTRKNFRTKNATYSSAFPWKFYKKIREACTLACFSFSCKKYGRHDTFEFYISYKGFMRNTQNVIQHLCKLQEV